MSLGCEWLLESQLFLSDGVTVRPGMIALKSQSLNSQENSPAKGLKEAQSTLPREDQRCQVSALELNWDR